MSHVPLSLPTEIERVQNPHAHSHSHNAPDLMSHIGGRGYRTSEKIYIPNEEQRRVWPSLLTIIVVKFCLFSLALVSQCVLCWVGSYWSMSVDLRYSVVLIMCMAVFTNTFLCTCIHTHIRTYTHTYIHTYVHTRIHSHTHTYIHAYIHTHSSIL